MCSAVGTVEEVPAGLAAPGVGVPLFWPTALSRASALGYLGCFLDPWLGLF